MAKTKTGNFKIKPGMPIQFKCTRITKRRLRGDNDKYAFHVAKTLEAFCNSVQKLLDSKYAHFKDIMPPILKAACNIFVIHCDDAILVRYDASSNCKSIGRYTVQKCSISDLLPLFSDYLLYTKAKPRPKNAAPQGPGIMVGETDQFGAFTGSPSEFKIEMVVDLSKAKYKRSIPPAKPLPHVILQNELMVNLIGTLAERQNQDTSFVANGRLPLKVGWQAIEVFPLLPIECWQKENVDDWAALEILSFAASRQLTDGQLMQLDPRCIPRKQFVQQLAEFESLLSEDEEPIHQFLFEHSQFLSPTIVQCWSKLAFGSKKCDFVLREPGNEYELVELESPHRQLFKKDGHPHADLTHAIGQTIDWIRYIEDNKRTVEQELGLAGISINPKRLIVIGRSASLSKENRRTLVTIQNQNPRMRILTYDDLLERARINAEPILGKLGLTARNMELFFYDEDKIGLLNQIVDSHPIRSKMTF